VPLVAAGFLTCAKSAIAQADAAPCFEPDAAVRLDHVTIAVPDLERAAEAFREHGFRLKPGRPHSNGIENAHAKFGDETELELLAVDGPTDELARWYEDFIAAGGGGAFVALRAGPVEGVAELLGAQGLRPQLQTGGPFEYASFPPDHELRHVYFVRYRAVAEDPPETFRHRNQSVALREVWIEVVAGSSLPTALLAMGARRCGALRHPAGFMGEAFGLANGRVILVSRVDESAYSRIVAVTLLGRGPAPDRLIPATEAEGVWIRIVSAGASSAGVP
jgi:catechol 2,3-dioxygenase-like lactoylglutathione lyase family enzyme